MLSNNHYRIKKKLTPYAYLSPCILLLCVILLYPLVNGIYLSVLDRDAFNLEGSFVGLRNFSDLLSDTVFFTALGNTLWWTLSVVAGTYLFGLMLALLLNQDVSGRFIFRAIILVPWVIPPAIAAIAWRWMYAEQYGVFNHIFNTSGLIQHNVAWLANPDIAMWAVIAVGIWKGIPFVAIVLLAGLQSIPREEYEAAMMDGANRRQRFRYVTFPHLTGISLIVIVLMTIWNVNQFALTHILTRGGPGNATQVLSTHTYHLFFSAFEFSTAAAVATVMLIIMMALTGIYIKRILPPVT